MTTKTTIVLRLSVTQARAMRRALVPDTRAAHQAAALLDGAIKRRGQAGALRVIDRAKLKRLARRGMSNRAIAAELGVSPAGVGKIRREIGC